MAGDIIRDARQYLHKVNATAGITRSKKKLNKYEEK